MSRNGSGLYTLPSPAPFQNGTTIDAPGMNTVQTDIAAALTGSTAADGQTPITGNWNFNSKNITNVNTISSANVVTANLATSGGATVGNALVVTKGGVLVSAGGGGIVGNTTITGDLGVSGTVTAGAQQVGAGGPTWTAGTGAPAGVMPLGSMYSRTDGGVGTTLYVSQGGGTWNPIAGV